MSRRLSKDSCKELAIHLKVSEDTIQSIWDEYKHHVDDYKFMLLWKWKVNNRHTSLQDLLTAIRCIDEDDHKMCQVMYYNTCNSRKMSCQKDSNNKYCQHNENVHHTVYSIGKSNKFLNVYQLQSFGCYFHNEILLRSFFVFFCDDNTLRVDLGQTKHTNHS